MAMPPAAMRVRLRMRLRMHDAARRTGVPHQIHAHALAGGGGGAQGLPALQHRIRADLARRRHLQPKAGKATLETVHIGHQVRRHRERDGGVAASRAAQARAHDDHVEQHVQHPHAGDENRHAGAPGLISQDEPRQGGGDDDRDYEHRLACIRV
jgi:hypothetical protein